MKHMLSTALLLLSLLPAIPAQAQKHHFFGYELFRDHGAVMLLIDSETGAIIDANRAASSYYGYPRELLLEMKIQQINTLSRNETEQEFRRAAEEQRNYFVFRHKMANGEIRPVEVYSSPVIIDGRRVLYSIIQDVSQRATLQESVVHSEARLRYAEKVAGLGHWTLDLNSNRYRFSEGALELLGLEGNSWDAAIIRRMILPEYRARMTELSRKLIEEDEPYHLQLRFQRPDGQVIDLASQGVYDAETGTIFGVIHDITAAQEARRILKSRTGFYHALSLAAVLVLLGIVTLLVVAVRRSKRSETALRDSESRNRALLCAIPDMMFILDGNGVFLDAHAPPAAPLLMTPQDFLGRGIHEVLPAEIAGLTMAHIAKIGQDSPIQTYEYRLRVHNGERFFESRLVACTGTTYLAIVRDVTERKHTETALQKKNEEVEQFVYSISHDLKSPLVTVRSFLGLLQHDIETADTGQIASDMDYIAGATDKIEQLLDALLQLSRIGRVDNPPQSLTADNLVKEGLAALAGPIHHKNIQVQVHALPWQLHGDPLRLGQIWQNLIENAVKYMGDQPHPRIEIGAEQENGDTVFYVRDNGIGIVSEHAERIFGVFTQLDPHSEGSGLGLALVRKIVDLYGGVIRVESEGPGQGSCFRFTLPQALEVTSALPTH